MARKIILSFIGLVFLLFAFFQWNDPDVLKWLLYYLLISVLSIASIFNVNKPMYIYAMLVLSFFWMIVLFPNAVDWFKDGMPSIVESMKADSPHVELVREFLGLSISIVALLYILFDLRKKLKMK